jgi:osmotically-inducible protein OsmY
MRLIRMVLTIGVLAVAAVLAYNYWNGHGWTLSPPAGVAGIDAEQARAEVTAAAKTTAAKAGEVAAKVDDVVAEGTLTAKIKAKMALDDLVKARTISVETTGTVVTLSGRVSSAAERDRAVRLAEETAGVTKVVNRLEIAR